MTNFVAQRKSVDLKRPTVLFIWPVNTFNTFECVLNGIDTLIPSISQLNMTMILFNEIIEIFRCTMTSGFEFKVFNQFRQCDRQLPRRTGDEDHILMIPISLVKKKSITSRRKETMVSDREKRVMLKDKIIYKWK